MNDSKNLLSLEGLVFEATEIKIDGHILSITLNRPEKRNAINTVMGNEIAYALSYALQEKNIRVVIIQAKGEVFCAGGEMDYMVDAILSPATTSLATFLKLYFILTYLPQTY